MAKAKQKLLYSAPDSQKAGEKPFHFFASSIAEWRTGADLETVLAGIKSGGLPFNLYYVPVSETAEYRISSYAPVVEGTVFLGFWDFTEAKKG